MHRSSQVWATRTSESLSNIESGSLYRFCEKPFIADSYLILVSEIESGTLYRVKQKELNRNFQIVFDYLNRKWNFVSFWKKKCKSQTRNRNFERKSVVGYRNRKQKKRTNRNLDRISVKQKKVWSQVWNRFLKHLHCFRVPKIFLSEFLHFILNWKKR